MEFFTTVEHPEVKLSELFHAPYITGIYCLVTIKFFLPNCIFEMVFTNCFVLGCHYFTPLSLSLSLPWRLQTLATDMVVFYPPVFPLRYVGIVHTNFFLVICYCVLWCDIFICLFSLCKSLSMLLPCCNLVGVMLCQCF